VYVPGPDVGLGRRVGDGLAVGIVGDAAAVAVTISLGDELGASAREPHATAIRRSRARARM
jgi:F0F1-type ATP synthase membrane subunit c/vacuolar-type H+-ATPase subunit K